MILQNIMQSIKGCLHNMKLSSVNDPFLYQVISISGVLQIYGQDAIFISSLDLGV